MTGARVPRLSIGLPVHDGERFLAQAIASLLLQDFTDFELLISDNASSDGTEQICRRFAAQDARVVYVRQPHNLGASPNWSFVAAAARGELFKWAACDDEYAPSFLSTCISILDLDPAVVLAHTATVDIDSDGTVLRHWDEDVDADHDDPARRFRELVARDHMCFQLFGVVRTSVLHDTRLLLPYPDADRVTLAELGLRGRVRLSPAVLFRHREHEGRSVNVHPASRDRLAWFDTSNVSTWAFPTWRLGQELTAGAWRAPLPLRVRVRAVLQMRVWLAYNGGRLLRNVARVGLDQLALPGRPQHRVAAARGPRLPTDHEVELGGQG